MVDYKLKIPPARGLLAGGRTPTPEVGLRHPATHPGIRWNELGTSPHTNFSCAWVSIARWAGLQNSSLWPRGGRAWP